MAKASYWWKQVRYSIDSSSFARIESPLIQSLSRKRVRKMCGWLLASFGIVMMFWWNWKLLLATVSGAGLMFLVYFMQSWNWQAYWLHGRQFLTGSGGKLSIAVGSGGFTALSTYIAASIWADSENRWLATGSILQGFGTVVTLIVLIWHVISDRNHRDESQFEQLLLDLTAVDPLKRLIAVRRLSTLLNKPRLRQDDRQQLIECFCLMLSQEQEPIVRETVFKSLQKEGIELPKNKGDRSLQIPLDLQRSPKRVYREI